jgi:hypothetical protein
VPGKRNAASRNYRAELEWGGSPREIVFKATSIVSALRHLQQFAAVGSSVLLFEDGARMGSMVLAENGYWQVLNRPLKDHRQ